MKIKRKLQEKSDVGMKRCHFMMPRNLHQDLRRYAFENEVSMSSIVVESVREYLQKKAKY